MDGSENSSCNTTETPVCKGSLGLVETMRGHRTPVMVTDWGYQRNMRPELVHKNKKRLNSLYKQIKKKKTTPKNWGVRI